MLDRDAFDSIKILVTEMYVLVVFFTYLNTFTVALELIYILKIEMGCILFNTLHHSFKWLLLLNKKTSYHKNLFKICFLLKILFKIVRFPYFLF